MKIIRFIIITVSFGIPMMVHAQEGTSLGVNKWNASMTYDMAVPFGNAKDFGGGFSPLGFGFDSRYFFNSNWAFGIATGWEVLYTDSSDPIQLNSGNTTISGKQNRYMNTIPILPGGYYYSHRDRNTWWIPFGGLGAGTFWEERRVNIGIFTVTESEWHFAIAPEVGIEFHFRSFNPVLRLRYNYLFSTSGSGDLPFLNISVGAAWN